MDLSHVEYTLRAEPFGFLAGMYNILANRRIQQQETNIKESSTFMPPRPATTTIAAPNNHSKMVNNFNRASCCEHEFLGDTESLPIKKLTELRQPNNIQV